MYDLYMIKSNLTFHAAIAYNLIHQYMNNTTPEQKRLDEHYSEEEDWLQWGPYLSERQWGTVREDYSANGDAWNYFPHEHARSRTYRWGEDGIAGISDRYCNICFGLFLWNGKDTILKERLFGLTGPAGKSRRRCKGIVLLP